MRTFYCASCSVHWAPYMCRDSQCPCCGGGLGYSHEPMTRGAVDLYSRARARDLERRARETARADSQRLHERFEEFYLQRERQRDAAQRNAQDDLEDQARLPTREDPA